MLYVDSHIQTSDLNLQFGFSQIKFIFLINLLKQVFFALIRFQGKSEFCYFLPMNDDSSVDNFVYFLFVLIFFFYLLKCFGPSCGTHSICWGLFL